MLTTARAMSSAKMRANRSIDDAAKLRNRRAPDAAAGRSQRTEIPQRLRVDQRAEAERLPRYRDVVLTLLVDELDEHAAVRPSLVELAGRVQVPRPEPERRRHAEAVAQRQARALQVVASFFGRIDERLQRDVVAELDLREQRFDVVEAGRLGSAGVQDLRRRLLRRRHVRLVDRIDAEHPSGKCRGELPAEELGAEVPGT